MLKPVDRNDWGRFFESFTLQHDHWLVHVDGEKESLPLEGILVREGRIVIHLGADIQHHRIITIDGAHVRVAQDDGVEKGLEIESTDGHVTRLAFRSPMPPELVDGMA
jgi:hypothetical protein